MNSSLNIVEGGGWVKHRAIGRPKAQWCGLLSLLWLGVLLCALSPFSDGWPMEFGYVEWLCLVILIPLPVFVVLVCFFFLTERPRRSFTGAQTRTTI